MHSVIEISGRDHMPAPVVNRQQPSLTVGVLADIPAGIGGGVNRFTQGLIKMLASQRPHDIRYVFFLAEDNEKWSSRPSDYISTVRVRATQFPTGWAKWLDRFARYGGALAQAARGNILQARAITKYRSRQGNILHAVRRSPWELDLVHFPFQDIAPLDVPMIFSPWDLQHLHLQEFWPQSEAKARDAYYRLGCRLASLVVLGSEWARQDVIAQYGLPYSKTAVIRVAAPTQVTEEVTPQFCADLKDKYGLPGRFMFYPSVTWKHKNHLRLITALAKIVHTSQSDLHLVCCGQNGRNLEDILAHADQVGVRDHVRFLGHVEDQEVRALYRLAEFCVYPSLFEGASLPVLEAFEEGCPLAASNVTCIPEYADDAARLFDPRDVDDITGAMRELASSDSRRRDLARRGKERASQYSWDRVAADYLSLYKQLAS